MANEMPLKYQVCTLEQAKELAELLGEHAPGSLWMWAVDHISLRWRIILYETYQQSLSQRQSESGELITSSCLYTQIYPAYTSDELAALFRYSTRWRKCLCADTPHAKAALIIQGLKEGWIKPEYFQYPDFD